MTFLQRKSAIVIIGAGPYGLSIAAHLRSKGMEFRIFGVPMQRWRAHMPKGMFLKSEGSASNLFDAEGTYTLGQYCANEGLRYSDWATPVAIDVFIRYGLSFQQRLIPNVENVMVLSVSGSSAGFELRLATGETVRAQKIVVATGMSHTAYVPPALRPLPSEVLSHSGRHDDLSGFRGRDVTVIGAGQSALETAALLLETGAQVRLIVRGSTVFWNRTPVTTRSVYERLRRPMSALGAGIGPWLYSNAAMLFCHLPYHIRAARVQKTLGPAGAWWLKDRVLGRLPIMLGNSVESAATCRDQVMLHLRGPDGKFRDITTDHVIAATGYRFNLRSLPFLSERLLSEVRCVQQTPVLSRNFESSVPGLYFSGFASVTQFGPAMRFLHGAGYTAKCIASHISCGRHRVSPPLSGTRSDVSDEMCLKA